MKALRSLLAIPIALALTACYPHPEPEASNREEAMKMCIAEVDEKMEEILEEVKLVKKYPERLNFEDKDYKKDVNYSWLHSDKYDDVKLIRSYCKPAKNQKHKGYWYVTGYLEYLTIPKEGSLRMETELHKSALSTGTSWKEDH